MRYEVREVNGMWVVFLGTEPITKAFRDRGIADDFARALNDARTARGVVG
jgi:hypothetical protein